MNKAIAIALCVFGIGVAGAAVDETHSRYFLEIGEPNPDAWHTMIDNPTDREKDMGAALAAMGGEMISDFWGLTDGKNFITVRFPGDPSMVQARYSSRLSQGALKDYTFIGLMTSADMIEALKRVPEFLSPVE